MADRCAGWRHGEAADDKSMPAAVSVFSLGSHIIKQRPEKFDPEEMVMLRGNKVDEGKGASRITEMIYQPRELSAGYD